MDRHDARAILRDCGIQPGEDFHRLESSKVEALLTHAKARKYRQPKNANGSRARYFHAHLQRVAGRSE